MGASDTQKLKHLLKKNSFEYLAERNVCYNYNCSRERIIKNLHLFRQSEPEPLFKGNHPSLTITCECCKTEYLISREDLIQNPSVLN